LGTTASINFLIWNHRLKLAPIKILEVYSGVETSIIAISDVSGLQEEIYTKQGVLTAGSNITIVDNVISSSGSGGSASNISDVSG